MILKYFKMYLLYLSQYFNMRLTYRKDFIISFIMESLNNITTFIFISIIFSHIPNLEGWSIKEVLLIYGLALIGRGLFLTFFGALEELGSEYIIDGHLDRLLIRPLNPLFLLVSSQINEKQMSEVFVGIIAIITSIYNLDLISIKTILIIIISTINSMAIYFGFFLMINSVSFWYNSRFSLMWTFMELCDFVQYPLTLFSNPIKFVLTWIIPLALTSYFPAILILGNSPFDHWIAFISPIVAVIFILLGYMTWKKGLDVYESTGS